MERSDLRQVHRQSRRPGAMDQTQEQQRFPQWILALAGLGCVLALVFGLFLGHRDLGPLKRELASLEREVGSLRSVQQREPTCENGEPELSQVRGFIAEGKLELAAALAETKREEDVLHLCRSAQRALASLWYSTSIDLLFASPALQWTVADDQRVVGRFLQIERQADTYGIPADQRLAPMTVATRAYNTGLWALSDVAFRRAWEEGDIGEEHVAFRYDILRNWGHRLAEEGGKSQRARAVELLATAVAIADTFHLTKGEACEDLQSLGYADCRKPLADPREPVLAEDDD